MDCRIQMEFLFPCKPIISIFLIYESESELFYQTKFPHVAIAWLTFQLWTVATNFLFHSPPNLSTFLIQLVCIYVYISSKRYWNLRSWYQLRYLSILWLIILVPIRAYLIVWLFQPSVQLWERSKYVTYACVCVWKY